jgi:hypothetical protein
MRGSAVVGLLLLAALPLSAAATSCTDDPVAVPTGTDAGTEAGVELPAEIVTFIGELCALYSSCCAPVPGGAQKCTADAEALAKGRTFDAVRAKKCVDSVRKDGVSPTFCARPPTSTTCGSVFKDAKTKATGEACTESTECASTAEADGVCLSGPKTCVLVTQGKSGDACIGTRIEGRTDGVTAAKDGAVCFASEGLHCSDAGKCAARASIGGPCAGADVSCGDDAWCPPTTGLCTSRTAKGVACEDSFECAVGSQCANDGEGSAACTAFAAEGGSCERGDECDPLGLVCDTSTTTCIKDVSTYASACSGAAALLQ